MAVQADLAAAAGLPHLVIEISPLLMAAIDFCRGERRPGAAVAGQGSSHGDTITKNTCTSRSCLVLASSGATSDGAPGDNDVQKAG